MLNEARIVRMQRRNKKCIENQRKQRLKRLLDHGSAYSPKLIYAGRSNDY